MPPHPTHYINAPHPHPTHYINAHPHTHTLHKWAPPPPANFYLAGIIDYRSSLIWTQKAWGKNGQQLNSEWDCEWSTTLVNIQILDLNPNRYQCIMPTGDRHLIKEHRDQRSVFISILQAVSQITSMALIIWSADFFTLTLTLGHHNHRKTVSHLTADNMLLEFRPFLHSYAEQTPGLLNQMSFWDKHSEGLRTCNANYLTRKGIMLKCLDRTQDFFLLLFLSLRLQQDRATNNT